MLKNRMLTLLCIVLFTMFGPSFSQYDVQAATVYTKWEKDFTSPLKSTSIKSGDIYVVDAKGKKIKAKLQLQKNLQTVVVSNLPTGNYKMKVKNTAYKKAGNVAIQTFSFKIVKSIATVKSEQQLANYFKKVLKTANSAISPTAQPQLTATAEGSKDASPSHSTTNNQVEGIEEGDMVAVNERYIFSVKDQAVIVTDTADVKNLTQVAKLTPVKNGYIQKVMLHNDLLLVVVNEYNEQPATEKMLYASGNNITKLVIYDVTNPANAKMTRTIGQQGYFTDIRKVKNTVYMIYHYTPDYWILNEGKPVELRPLTYDSAKSSKYTVMPYSDLSILPATSDAQYSIIKAIDLTSDSEGTVTTKGYLGSSSGVFMSNDALYLTAYKYDESQPTNATSRIGLWWRPLAVDTSIYKWQVNGTSLNFVSSATVKGNVLNQYSMDEHNGHFRIATTEGFTWDGKNPSKNHLFVLNDTLQVVGQLNDLAPGERIYSARFMGDKAYLVTFKQVDPLFVIDVANPTAPKVLGELKIPGYSNYLHPLDDNHLIGIGYNTETVIDEYTKEPRVTNGSMKLSLFDVTDVQNPIEQQNISIGGRGSYSEVQHDPKAFFRHVERGLYGFPVTLYNDETGQEYVYKGSGAQIFNVSVENGIQLTGDLVEISNGQVQSDEWERTVQRIVYIGDTLFTVSRSEINSYDLNSFEQLSKMKID